MDTESPAFSAISESSLNSFSCARLYGDSSVICDILCYKGINMALKKSQRSLKAWTKQKWRTKSGKPSTQGPKATGERYLPSSAIKSLSPQEYAATTRAKRKATKAGKQFSKQPKKIRAKVKPHRKVK